MMTFHRTLLFAAIALFITSPLIAHKQEVRSIEIRDILDKHIRADIKYLSSDELTNDEVEGIFRIRLFSLEEDGYTLKFPLLDSDYVSRFDDFWRMLLGPEYGLTTKGHRINLKNYTPLAKSEGVRRAFELLDERMRLDLDRMCRVISQYYRETEFAVGLEKYLREIAETEYQNFEETVDHRII